MAHHPHAQYGIFIGWDGSDTFAGADDDVTDYQLAQPALVIEYGRDTGRSTGTSRPGTATFDLNNDGGEFSPENPSSFGSGDLLRARPVYVRAVLDAVTYRLYQGATEDFTPRYGRTAGVSVSCVDGLAQLGEAGEISSSLYSGLRTGDAIGVVLDLVGWSGGRDLDPGQTMLPWFWLEADNPLDAIQKLIDGEGMPAYAGCDANGNFVFRDRGHRHVDPECLSVQATWRASGTEPRFSLPVTYDHGVKDVINSINVKVDHRRPITLGPVWTQEDAGIVIPTGETIKILASASDPFYDARTPDAAVDISDTNAVDPDIGLRFGTVSVSLSRTSGASTEISVTALSGPAEIDRLRLRAVSVPVSHSVQVQQEHQASISKYRRRGPGSLDPRWASVWDVQAVVSLMLSSRAERLPVFSVPFTSGTTDILVEQLRRNLSDRVRIIYPDADLDREAFVETIRHEITGRGTDRKHTTVFTCEAAPVTFTNLFIVGTSTLNGGDVLAPDGFIDPGTMLILDDPTSLLGSRVLAY